MINIEVVDLSVLICFWLAFCRWSSLLIQIPILDNVGEGPSGGCSWKDSKLLEKRNLLVKGKTGPWHSLEQLSI